MAASDKFSAAAAPAAKSQAGASGGTRSRPGRLRAPAAASAAHPRELFERWDFASLKALLARSGGAELAKAWPGLEPLAKAACFKLLRPAAALTLYRMLPPAERYFLLCSFDPGSIAPILEGAAPNTRALFQRFPDDVYDEMTRLA